MILPRIGDEYPIGGQHARHQARITAIDTHGIGSWEDLPEIPPTILVECSCGEKWLDALPEAVAVGGPVFD